MSLGTPAPAPRRAVARRCPRRCGAGGYTFAEDPGIGAPDARILWHEALDPGALAVSITPVIRSDPDAVDLTCLAPWLTIVDGYDAREHAVLSDGWRRIRFDVHAGTLRDGGTVVFHYHLHGTRSAEPKLLPLRRLITLCRAGRFAATFYPPDRRLPRWIEFLRAGDARASGASYRDIAIAVFGEDRTRREWHDPGRSLHSHVRRLVAGAAAMAAGGYRDLLRSPREPRPGRTSAFGTDGTGSVPHTILHVHPPRLGWTTMRTDLDHLPDRKRRDLDRIVEVLFAEFEQATSLSTQKWRRQGRILKVILYGSYARGDWVDDPIGGYQSDYDIFVVVSDERLTDPAEFWAKADDQFVREVTIAKRITAPVTFIVHSLAEVNDQLTHGRPFFIDVVEQGIALYAVEDYPFVTPRPLEPTAALAEARKHFDQWFPSASEFLELGTIAARSGMLNKSAFLFHQAAEQFYHSILLTLTLYSPKSHKLNFLRSQAEPLVPDLIAVWPRDTRFAQRCFELLRQAYVNARYSPHYRISAAELEWLAERVTLLQQIVRDACEARLASG